MKVHKLIVDSKSSKNLPLWSLSQCDELVMDECVYFEQRDLVKNYNFTEFMSGSADSSIEMVCSAV